jgi:hypothetical protein
MSVILEYVTNLTVREILEANTGSAGATDRTVKHSLLNKSVTLNAASTPPVSKVAAFEKALVGGAATIDLTALVGTNGAAVDGTGLKVRAIKIIAKDTNANPITITKGLTNGYALAGNTFNWPLSARQEQVFYGDDSTPVVAAGAKTLDLAGTGTQSVTVIVVLG